MFINVMQKRLKIHNLRTSVKHSFIYQENRLGEKISVYQTTGIELKAGLNLEET